MKVFLSSVIKGYEDFRNATEQALKTLDHEVIRAENFPAIADTPKKACLQAVHDADMVILLLGKRYGTKQSSGRSATHEEYLEANNQKPILVFIQSDIEFDLDQQSFITEVESWGTGNQRVQFSTPSDLKDKVIRSMHRFQLEQASTQLTDHTGLLNRAKSLLLECEIQSNPHLVIIIACAPLQRVIRPSELYKLSWQNKLKKVALFGKYPIFNTAEGI